jgi:hypothetical protein
LQDQINTKLDASEYNQHFRGVYVDLAALQIAIPTANDGDYAHIDLGVGSDREVAIWDNDDAIWVASTGSVASTTDEVAEGSTNRYFTETRVRATPLTGFTPSPNSPVLSTDQLLAAIGKLQAQINSMGSGGGGSSGGITWVNVKTIGTLNSIINNSYTEIEVAKIDGMLWLRGVARITNDLTGNIFTVTNSSYFLTIKRPPAFGQFYDPTTSDTVTATFKIGSLWAIGSMPDAYILVYPSGGFKGTMTPIINKSVEYIVIPAIPIGRLLTP